MITRLLVAVFFAAVLGVAQTELNLFFFSTTESLFRESIEEERGLAAKRGDNFGVAAANRLLSEGDPAGYGEFIAKLEKKLEAWKASELQRGVAGAFCGKTLDLSVSPLDAKEGSAKIRVRMRILRNGKEEIPYHLSDVVFIKLGVDRAFATVIELVKAAPPIRVEPPKKTIIVPSGRPIAQIKAQPRRGLRFLLLYF